MRYDDFFETLIGLADLTVNVKPPECTALKISEVTTIELAVVVVNLRKLSDWGYVKPIKAKHCGCKNHYVLTQRGKRVVAELLMPLENFMGFISNEDDEFLVPYFPF